MVLGQASRLQVFDRCGNFVFGPVKVEENLISLWLMATSINACASLREISYAFQTLTGNIPQYDSFTRLPLNPGGKKIQHVCRIVERRHTLISRVRKLRGAIPGFGESLQMTDRGLPHAVKSLLPQAIPSSSRSTDNEESFSQQVYCNYLNTHRCAERPARFVL